MNGVKKKASLKPSFELPGDFDVNRYELWTVRLPSQFNAKELDGTTIRLNEATSIESKGQEFAVQLANTGETESFRLLVPKKAHGDDAIGSDSDSDSDESDHGKAAHKDGNSTPDHEFQPLAMPFKNHLIVASTLRPHEEMSTDPVPPKVAVRHAYAHVPQKTGLKRRWAPIGGGTAPVVLVPLANDAAGDDKPLVKRSRADNGSASSPQKASTETNREHQHESPTSDAEDSIDSKRKSDGKIMSKKERKEAKKKRKEKKAKKQKNANK